MRKNPRRTLLRAALLILAASQLAFLQGHPPIAGVGLVQRPGKLGAAGPACDPRLRPRGPANCRPRFGQESLLRSSSSPRSGGSAVVSVLNYSTFVGGNSDDSGNAVATDSAGNVYVAGSTASTNLLTTAGVLQTSFGGGDSDAFVMKLSPAGALVYLTYLGGSGTTRRLALP